MTLRTGSVSYNGETVYYHANTVTVEPKIMVKRLNGADFGRIPAELLISIQLDILRAKEESRPSVVVDGGEVAELHELCLLVFPRLTGFFCEELILAAAGYISIDETLCAPTYWQLLEIDNGWIIAPANPLLLYQVLSGTEEDSVEGNYFELEHDEAGAIATLIAIDAVLKLGSTNEKELLANKAAVIAFYRNYHDGIYPQ